MLNLTNRKILLISPDSWGVNYLSKHHFAIELSKVGNKVYFLNPPARLNNMMQIDINLQIIDFKLTFRGLRLLPEYISGFLIKKEIEKLEKWLDSEFDMIWNFDSSRFFNLTAVKNKYKIAHIVDWSENFNRRSLCKSSDLCLCTSEFLRVEMAKSNPKTYNIGHGYSTSTYRLDQFEKNELENGFEIKIGYAGNLGIKYLDWDLFYDLIIQNPKVGFYFIGPASTSNLAVNMSENLSFTTFKKIDNVFFLGEKAGYKLSAYLSEFDILLLVYKGNQHKEQLANPHKMLEYLSSGKVIVSTWTEEYKDKLDLIEMVENNSSLPNRFSKVLNNLEFYNNVERQLKRRRFAFENSYEKKIQTIELLIHESYQQGK
jgi:glycosyltransferase involved in cell wall biosynthesis